MADLKEIITLINAGYSKEDIDAMTSKNEPIPEDSKPEEKPVEPEEPEKPVEPKEKAVDDYASNEKVLERLDKLEKMLQKNAILSDSVNPTPKDTTKDILASIINPYLEDKKE